MANHKKKRHPAARSYCSMCKPWKDGVYSHESPDFERFSAHKQRISLKKDIEEVA